MVRDRTESENNGSPRIFHDLWWNCKLLEFVLKQLYWLRLRQILNHVTLRLLYDRPLQQQTIATTA